MIAALFVATGGAYFNLPGVDPWDEARDARKYAGPWPVVAHPPCERWGRYWGGGPMLHGTPKQKVKGDDGGCFAAALAAVRKFGGVLEHPEASAAWAAFGLNTPPHTGAWVVADWVGGWTCCVEQGHFGHRSRKKTWLYANGVELPSLTWGKSAATAKMDAGFRSTAERRRVMTELGELRRDLLFPGGRLSKRERPATPPAFRDLLISMAQQKRRTNT